MGTAVRASHVNKRSSPPRNTPTSSKHGQKPISESYRGICAVEVLQRSRHVPTRACLLRAVMTSLRCQRPAWRPAHHAGRRHQRTRCRAELQTGADTDSQGSGQAAPVAQRAEQVDAAECPHCGAPESNIPFGCDRAGHKSAGIGAFVAWWPLKVWSPCPRAKEKGMPYVRKGQSIDEVLFGRSDKTPE